MATRKQQPAKVKTVANEDYSKLDQYAIELHEFYKSLRRQVLLLIMLYGYCQQNKHILIGYKKNQLNRDILKHLEDEDEDD
jgi:hypothetical protein